MTHSHTLVRWRARIATPHVAAACDTRSHVPSNPPHPPKPPPPPRHRSSSVTDAPPELAGAIFGTRSAAMPATDAIEDLTDDLIEEVTVELDAEIAPALPSGRTFVPAAKGPRPDALTVLVVEDDESIRALVVRALGTQYVVYEAVDGQEACEILDALPPPACIISDVMMPRLDGIGLAKKIKSTPALKWTPVIFLTAKNGALDVVQGINAGARHYLSKPFKMKELLDKVASIVGAGAKKA